MNNLIQQIVAWASVAYNWLKHFFKLVWGFIQSYWPKLKEMVKQWLIEYSEVIVLDGRENGGREMLEALQKSRPNEISLDDLDGLVTLAINANKTIAKVGDIDATVQQQDQYDAMASQNNGILRING